MFRGNLNIDWQCRDIKELRVDSFLGVFMVVLWLCLEFFHIQKSLQKFVRVSKGRGESKTGRSWAFLFSLLGPCQELVQKSQEMMPGLCFRIRG